MDQVDGRPGGLDLGLGEAFEHKSSLRSAVYFSSRHRARRPATGRRASSRDRVTILL
jgi:hypothetical protein